MQQDKYFICERMIQRFMPKGINFFYVCAGRGLGKTYSALDLCLKIANKEFIIDESLEKQRFIYLRRTEVQARASSMPSTNPFKKYNRNEGTAIWGEFNTVLRCGEFYTSKDDKSDPIGYCCALSTFQNLRGVDYSDVVFIVYDECLTEDGSSTRFKNEGFTLMNLYETVNRNRILEGKPEVVLLLLSNPIDLASALLAELDFTKILANMILKEQQRYTDPNRSLHIEKLIDHSISEEKAKGALYKFAPKAFTDQALSGDFTENDMSLIEKVNLDEYYPYIGAEVLVLYRHKSKNLYYISASTQLATYNFKMVERETIREAVYFKYKLMLVNRVVKFDSFKTKMVFESLIRYKQPT